jgi:phosphocarrier protein
VSSPSCSATVKIRNKMGLHARPATQIVQLLFGKQDQVRITYRKKSVDAKSLLNLLLLAIPRNAKITIDVTGPDAPTTLQVLLEAIQSGLGE